MFKKSGKHQALKQLGPGLITGPGLTANIRRIFPRLVLMGIVGLLVVADTNNIAADIAALGEALQLLVGGGAHFHAIVFGFISYLFFWQITQEEDIYVVTNPCS